MKPAKLLHEYDAEIAEWVELLLAGLDPPTLPGLSLAAYEITAYVTSSQRGRAYNAWQFPGSDPRFVTVPLWAWKPGDDGCYIHERDPDYGIYYLAHEIAHHLAPAKKGDVHGPAFMAAFKAVCPKELWHHETGYKPRNAAAAGIAKESK
jgi:hypothetical protein